jgi:hypothetical protein
LLRSVKLHTPSKLGFLGKKCLIIYSVFDKHSETTNIRIRTLI